MGLPDATVLVLQGLIFLVLLTQRDAVRPVHASSSRSASAAERTLSDSALLTVLIAMLGGAIRVSTPFMFVSLGECLTEKSGRINLGLEGTLVLGAMSAYAISYLTGSPWLGVLVAGLLRRGARRDPRLVCSLPQVNDVAIGIALMLFGIGLAFFFGKAFIQPRRRACLPSRSATGRAIPALASALQDQSAVLRRHRARRGAVVGLPQHAVRPHRAHDGRQRGGGARHGRLGRLGALLATTAGGFLAGVGGAFLSLYYPGSLERGPVVRPGPDGGRARHLRALEPAALLRSPRCCSARRARSARRCSRSASRRATTSSTPRPTS